MSSYPIHFIKIKRDNSDNGMYFVIIS